MSASEHPTPRPHSVGGVGKEFKDGQALDSISKASFFFPLANKKLIDWWCKGYPHNQRTQNINCTNTNRKNLSTRSLTMKVDQKWKSHFSQLSKSDRRRKQCSGTHAW